LHKSGRTISSINTRAGNGLNETNISDIAVNVKTIASLIE